MACKGHQVTLTRKGDSNGFMVFIGILKAINNMEVEKEISLLKKRNERVEADKAWERSFFRVISIALLTYVTVLFALYLMRVPTPLLNALIPPIGYILSTQSLPFIKRWWVKKFHRSEA